MKRKQLWRVLGTGCLAASLLVSPMTGLSALAADENTEDTGTTGEGGTGGTGTDTKEETPKKDAPKEGASKKGLNPLQKAKDAVGTEGTEGYQPAVPGNSDAEIPVWGWVDDSIVYSVDVEWGAMTFRYESSSWDPETHMKKGGSGWQVYDSVNDKVAVDAKGAAETEHAINEIKVTNHSNASVWATLDYAGKKEGTTDYTGIKGAFTYTPDKHGNVATALTPVVANKVPAYLTLGSADNAETEGAAGTPTVGKAYFMPTNPAEGEQAPSDIEKWTQIGTITVGIKTEQPKEATQGTTEP